MTKLKQLQEATKTRDDKIAQMINKYERFISNLEWHIETNHPEDSVIIKINEQIYQYQQFVTDLKFI